MIGLLVVYYEIIRFSFSTELPCVLECGAAVTLVMAPDMPWLTEAQSVGITLPLSSRICLLLLVSKPSWHEVGVKQAPCGEAFSCS